MPGRLWRSNCDCRRYIFIIRPSKCLPCHPVLRLGSEWRPIPDGRYRHHQRHGHVIVPLPLCGLQVLLSLCLPPSYSEFPPFVDPNYIDPTLNATEWQSQYFGQNIDRLMQIKAAYDPNKVFTFPQSIPLPESITLALNGTGNPHGSGSWSTRAIRRRSTVNGCIVLSLVMVAVTNFF